MNKKAIIAGIVLTALLIAGYAVLDSILFEGIRPRTINEQGIQASFYASPNLLDQPAVIIIGGGAEGAYWGQEFANAGINGLSLPYYRQPGLPELLEEIPLEYVEQAIDWLGAQPEVNPNKIIVMGASRNAELALLTAAQFPKKVHGVIAFAPSSVSWSNTVLPFNSDELKPSWTIGGNPVPFIPMNKIAGSESSSIETLPYWKMGLSDSSLVAEASIPVEHINGPILLFSGLDDQVWPSAMMSDMIDKRLRENGFPHKVENIQYENAGHLISRNLATISQGRTGQMPIDGKRYDFEFGGTVEGDQAAISTSHDKIMAFLHNL